MDNSFFFKYRHFIGHSLTYLSVSWEAILSFKITFVEEIVKTILKFTNLLYIYLLSTISLLSIIY